MALVLIDNYDSFTWNIYQYLCSLGADVRVYRNDKTTVEEVAALKPAHIVISPGPGHPSTDAGVSKAIIAHFAGKVPILGVCLGHQCIYEMYGGTVSFAGEIVHGKTSALKHDGKGLFLDVPQDVEVTRYHSLAGDPATLPSDLVVTARTADGVIEGLRHRSLCIVGVQFHPESILSGYGMEMFATFLRMHAGTWAEQPEFKVDSQSVELPTTPKAGQAKVEASHGAPTILQRIQAQRKLDVAAAKSEPGRAEHQLRALVEANACEPAIDLYRQLQGSAAPGNQRKGLQARRYAEAGAAVISVLTEPTWFRGRIEDLRQARDAVAHLPYRPAILRKDFIIDTYQIYEARLAGADTILLIVAILTDVELTDLMNVSRSLGMEPLVEVNNSDEMQRALSLGARVIGVNNRNLHTFDVDPSTTTQLAQQVPPDVILAALSGITKRADVEPYLVAGASAVLVGEALMRSKDPATFIRELRAVKSPLVVDIEAPIPTTATEAPLVKICGIRTVEAALVAVEAGAKLIGMIFAPTRRRVTVGRARAIVEAVRTAASTSVTREIIDGTTTEVEEDNIIGGTPCSDAVAANMAGLNWFDFHVQQISKSPRPLLVGVFQNQSVEYMTRVARDVGLDFIQLHGQEPTEVSTLLPVPTLHDRNNAALLRREVRREGYHAIPVLDALVVGAAHQGGQGVIAPSCDAQPNLPVILAGGLNPQNIAGIVNRLKPWAVDVSSGIETDGVQDVAKIRAFIKAAQGSL
ncbi:N-anthranilate isomerase [Syncephalis fuscata]|nr:N-anthranilate isomerase [Syncephalis fuscata]